MKYAVLLEGRVIEVVVEGDRVTVDGRSCTATLGVIPGTPLRQLLVEGRPSTVAMESQGRGRWVLTAAGERWEVEVLDERTRHIRSLTAASDRQLASPALKAPMPGLVLRVEVKAGQPVAAGASLVVLEAMKMENELKAQAAGAIKAVLVSPGEAVEKGQVLVEFDPAPLPDSLRNGAENAKGLPQ